MNLFINTAASAPFEYAAWVLLMMFSICVHEYAHARTALHHGDDTAAWMGHLSLNPLIQMGAPSIVVLLLFGIAWGAVPVNVRNLRSRTRDAWVAAAGPLSNLLLCILFAALAVAAAFTPWGEVAHVLRVAAAVNGVLCLFNLLPIPMFDGWAIASLWIPTLQRISASQSQSFSWIALLILWWTPIGDVIWVAGTVLSQHCMRGWIALLGVFA